MGYRSDSIAISRDMGPLNEEKHDSTKVCIMKYVWSNFGHCGTLVACFAAAFSLAIPHLKSFAAIPSVSLVQLGHTNRNVFLSHESQREIAVV